jgi:hypothetical protein
MEDRGLKIEDRESRRSVQQGAHYRSCRPSILYPPSSILHPQSSVLSPQSFFVVPSRRSYYSSIGCDDR